MRVGGTYYAYAAQTGPTTVQGMQSSGTVRWHGRSDALLGLPPWAEWGHTWAPVGAAAGTGLRPLRHRPWPALGAPVHLHRDDNAGARPTSIWGQRLSPDGLTRVGAAVPLLTSDAAWEGSVIEGLAMVRVGGQRYLFYAANDYDSPDAAIGFATLQRPARTVREGHHGRPLDGVARPGGGPGRADVLHRHRRRLRIGYHAWTPGRVGYAAGGSRSLWIDRLDFVDGRPVVSGL